MTPYIELILLSLGIIAMFIIAVIFVIYVLLPALLWLVKWLTGE